MKEQRANHIVIVSDDRETDGLLRRAFDQSAPGCTVTIVHRPEELLSASLSPSLILLDLMLAGDSPFEALRWLKAEPRFTRIPIFVLGSKVIDNDVDEAYRLGAHSCLLKESEASGLQRIVRAVATYVSLTGETTGRDCTCLA